MKKKISILSVVILFMLVTGCSSSIEKKENASENSNKSTVNTKVNVTTNESSDLTNKESVSTNSNSSGISEPVLDSFFGEWNTTKRLIIPSVYSEEELKERDMVGHKVIIKSDYFSDANSQFKKPYYKVSNITDNEFVGENIGTFANSSLGQLNIRNKSTITKLDVYSNESLEFLIETFYLEDENTIITNSNFIAFFELKRIK